MKRPITIRKEKGGACVIMLTIVRNGHNSI